MIVIMTVIGSFGNVEDAAMIVVMTAEDATMIGVLGVIILIIFMMIVIIVITVIMIISIISFFYKFQMWR